MKETRGFGFALYVMWVHGRSQPVYRAWMWKLMPNCPVLTLLKNIWVSQTATQQMYRQGMVSGDHALWVSLESNGEIGDRSGKGWFAEVKSCSSRREIYGLLSLFPGCDPAPFQEAAKAVCWLCWRAGIRSFEICDRADDPSLILENTRFCYYLVASQMLTSR